MMILPQPLARTGQALRRRRPLNAFIRGIGCLWIVGAGLATQGALVVVPMLPLAQALGVLAMLWVLPALLCSLAGIIGLPSSWMDWFQNVRQVVEGKPWPERLVLLIGTVWQCLLFRPFSCPFPDIPLWVQMFFFREKEAVYPPSHAGSAPVQDEYWIYINGMVTNQFVAQANAQRLYEIFGRPVTVCLNPTDGFLVDLLECIVDKLGLLEWFWKTQPQEYLRAELQRAIVEAAGGKYKRVVLVAHSQGTIIASKTLQQLAGMTNFAPLMKKHLLVFNFADCAHTMSAENVRYLENVSNQRDTVSWLGVLFPFPDLWEDVNGNPISIGGAKVTDSQRWGHLLNTHYLEPLRNGAYPASLLHHFRDGRSPPRGLLD